jgi:hypothetical protein
VSPTPKRYRFDNELPSFEPRPLPVPRPDTSVGQSPTVAPAYFEQQQYAQPQVIHVHQAPPDRTVQRLALGAGVGAGAVAGAVYFGPLLVASLWSIAIIFAVGGLVLAVIVRGITAVLGNTQQPKGKRHR